MSSKRELIVQDVLAMLNASRPAGVPEILDSDTYAVDLDQVGKHVSLYQSRTMPLYDVRDPQHLRQPKTDFATFLSFRISAKGSSTTRPRQEIDVIYVWIVKTCCSKENWKGPYNGQLYSELAHGPLTQEHGQVDHGWESATLDIIALHQTRANDPETWA